MRCRNALAWVGMVGAVLTLPVMAQTGGGAGRTGPSAAVRGSGSGMPERPRDERPAATNLNELVALRLSQLEEDLRLQPQQAAAWIHYRDSVQRLLDDRRRAQRTMAAEATAPQRLDGIADGARNRLAAVEDVAEAGKALYILLSAEQRVVADRRLALPLATVAGTDTRADDGGASGGRAPGAPAGAAASTSP